MILYVTRHGETQWNTEDLVCGWTDVNLSPRGIEQASVLAEKLKDIPIDRIFASPLKRSRITAQIVADAVGLPITVDERLMERNFGDYEGAQRTSAQFIDAKKQYGMRLPGGGESLFQLAHRIYGFLEELKIEYPHESILLVGHGALCRVLHTYFYDLTNEEYLRYNIGNCELKQYEL